LLRQAARLPGLRLGEKSLQITGVIVFGLLLGLPLTSFSYPKQYEAFAGGLKNGVAVSYEMAGLVNEKVKNGEPLLLMPMLYRIGPEMPDPIFYWYLEGNKDIHRVIDLNLSYQDFKKRVIGLRITWVLLSPVDDSLQWEIFEQLVEEINPEGFKFSKGVLVRVSGLWEKQINKQPTPEGPGQ
jgi:hypothetical protein